MCLIWSYEDVLSNSQYNLTVNINTIKLDTHKMYYFITASETNKYVPTE